MEFLLPALVFVAAFAAVIALPRRSSGPVTRLARHQVITRGAVAVAPKPRVPILGGVRTGTAGALATRIAGQGTRSKSERLLLEAGSPMPLATYLLLRAGFMFVLAPVLALGALDAEGLSLRGIGMAAAGLVVVPLVPQTWLKRKARKRARRIELVMPDALDLLVVCVEGGLSLDAGLQQVARRTDGLLAEELRRLQAEVGTGMTRRDAFQALAARSQSESLRIFCTTIVQADKMGMSISSTVRTMVETMRTKRRQAAETQARKAPIKMLPFLVLFMIPSLFVVILGPAVLEIMEFFNTMNG